jgi:hypothetical protein
MSPRWPFPLYDAQTKKGGGINPPQLIRGHYGLGETCVSLGVSGGGTNPKQLLQRREGGQIGLKTSLADSDKYAV